jgi:hypothetical protein
MGDVADSMLNGEVCAECGVYLEPREKVYVQSSGKATKMPADGSGHGLPVICADCH